LVEMQLPAAIQI